MKRIVALGLIVVAASTSLLSTGCSGCNNGGNDDDSTPTPTPTPPTLTSVAPVAAIPGTTVTLTGTSLGDTQGSSTVLVGAAVVTTTISWSATSVQVVLPDEARVGLQPVTVEVAGTPTNALDLDVLLPPAAYTNNDLSPNTVSAYLLQGTSLAPISGSPYSAGATSSGFGGCANTMALHAASRRLYAVSDTQLHGWDIHPRTGALTAAFAPLTVGTNDNYGVTVNTAGNRLYVPIYGPNLVHVLAVGTSGAPTELGSPVGSAIAGGFDSVHLTPDEAFLYVNDESLSELVAFAVAGDGTLTEGLHEPGVNSGYDFAFSPNGNFLYSNEYGNAIRIFAVENDGSLTETADSPVASTGKALALAPGGRVYAPGATGTIDVYDRNNGTGALTPIGGSPFTMTGDLNCAAVSRDGAWLIVQDEGGSGVHLYGLSGTGVPTEVSGSPFTQSEGGDPTGLVITF